MNILIQGIIFCVACLALLVLNKKRKFPLSMVKMVFCIFVVSSVISCYVVSKFIIKYDNVPVTITAVNKANSMAEGNEIIIKGFIVDGKIYPPNQIVSGKWISGDNHLAWQGYNQPPNLTDSIKLLIPAGKNRQILFQSNKWRGIASISYGNITNEVDCFSSTEEGLTCSGSLASSDFTDLMQVYGLKFFVSCLLLALFLWIGLTVFKHKKVAKKFVQKNIVQIVCAIIALFTLSLMVHYSAIKSLWSDDIAQIYFTYPGLSVLEMFNRIRNMDLQPPMAALISAIWLRIAPYGTAWIKLPAELAVTVGIFICGMVGNKLQGKRTGILCSIFAASSSTLIIDAGYTFRPYGFFFLFSTVVLLAYVNRINHIGNESKKDLICYGIALTFMVYTHYFGILLCAALFLSDVLLYIDKRIKLKCIFSYVLTGVLFAPWGLMVMANSAKSLSAFWPQTPTVKSMIDALNYLLSNNSTLILVFAISLALLIFQIFFTPKDGKWLNTINYVQAICLWCIIFVIGITFVYSAVINRSKSVFVTRYFMGLLPYAFLLLATGLDSLCILVSETKSQLTAKALSLVICVGFVFTIVASTYPSVAWSQNQKYETWEQTADWLYNQQDVQNNNVLTVITGSWIDGWDYYLTHMGQREGIHRVESGSITADMLENINKIYLFTVHEPITPGAQKLINQKFHEESKNDDVSITTYVRN